MSLTPSQSTERLRELVAKTPASGKKRSIGFLAVVACLGGFLFGYDTGVISGALPYMHLPSEAGGLALTSLEEGLIGGFLLFGSRAVGAIVGGRLSDRYGRRHNILPLAVLFFVGAVGLRPRPEHRPDVHRPLRAGPRRRRRLHHRAGLPLRVRAQGAAAAC
ncbi:MFS transporter [Brachybacterium sp. GPGPB12]|uniref:MFS transporter n=1 Tax=Brachybacterium sp. GPGPB12 TaxID=3023517 RepID=UPI0031345293